MSRFETVTADTVARHTTGAAAYALHHADSARPVHLSPMRLRHLITRALTEDTAVHASYARQGGVDLTCVAPGGAAWLAVSLGSAFDDECAICLHWKNEHGHADSACAAFAALTDSDDDRCPVCDTRRIEHGRGALTVSCPCFLGR